MKRSVSRNECSCLMRERHASTIAYYDDGGRRLKGRGGKVTRRSRHVRHRADVEVKLLGDQDMHQPQHSSCTTSYS